MDRVAPAAAADPDETPLVAADRIEAAMRRIDPIFLKTPIVADAALDGAVNARVIAKLEIDNPSNFGQALAYCTRAMDVALTVYAAQSASPTKIAAMRRLGAEVRLVGHDFDGAKAAARGHAERTGDTLAEDSAEASFAEGAGTIGLEFSAQAPDLDYVLVALGNGALAAGVGAWMVQRWPSTAVVGVVAEGAPAMKLSFQKGTAVETSTAHTIADGIATRVPVDFGLASCLEVLAGVVSVSDEAILTAMRLIHRTLGLVVEPSAAVGVAALASDPQFARSRVGVIICGSNVSPAQQREWSLE